MPTVEKAASEYTDYVKKRASVVGRREFSDSLFNSLILQSSVGRGLGNTPDVPPPDGGDYGVMTGFSNTQKLSYPITTLPSTFTIELFFKYSSTLESGFIWNLDTINYFDMYISGETLIFEIAVSSNYIYANIGTVSANRWYHASVTYDDGSWYTSINGVVTPQTLITPNLSGLGLVVGAYNLTDDPSPFSSGSISNFRITASALYTSDFTVPTLPLNSDANTLLLLLAKSQSTVAVDSSSYKRVAEGTCGWLAGPIEYPPSGGEYGVISGFSNGNYLTVPTSGLGMSGDFTVECFAFIPETNQFLSVFSSGDWGIYISDYIQWYDYFVSKEAYNDKWTHLAMVHDNGVDYMYVDGVQVGSYTRPIGNVLYIGYYEGETVYFTNGKISNFRVSNIARYTQNFTPELPLVSDANTTLRITDSLSNVTKVGDDVTLASELITSYIPSIPSYGVISGFSNQNYLAVPTSGLGMSGDFTVECFAFIPDTESDLGIFGTGLVGIGVYGGFIFQNDVSVSKTNYVNKWTHIAIVSVSGIQYVYVDGEQFGSYSQTIGSTLYIGADTESNFTNGKISTFRVSDFARYTQNFSPSIRLGTAGATLLITDSLTNDVLGGAAVERVGNPTIASELILYTS